MVLHEIDTALLPPRERAGYFHFLLVDVEIMRKRKLGFVFGLEPHVWGWQRANGRLVLIMMNKLLTPEVLSKGLC